MTGSATRARKGLQRINRLIAEAERDRAFGTCTRQ